ncbi:hypothetical protein AB0F88_16665 [Streptosporangium sp. NPDC023963]|uniref:hypothetical protein n=1 Tax=Streptosporangium sp. NPDC023963 TaxID=3155608 RepID=UPI0034278710
MSDDVPSLAEVMRRLGDVRTDIRDDLADLRERQEREWAAVSVRLDQLVTRDRYEAERVAMLDRISKLEVAVERAAERRGLDWRQFMFSGLIPAAIFLCGVLVQIFMARGGAP